MQIPLLTKITLLLISLTTMMANVAVVTVIPHLKEYFTNENIELLSRLMVTLPSVSIAILAPFLGHLVFKVGKKPSAIFALILFALTGTTGLYLDSLNMILFSRAIFGIAIAVLMIVTTSLVGDYFQGEQRHKYMGIQTAFVSFGGLIFVIGGGVLSDISWRLPFAIYFIGLVLLPFAIFFLKESKVEDSFSDTLENPNSKLLNIYLLAFLLMLVFFILPTQMPFLMINHFGASGTLTGVIISSAFLFNAFGALSFPKLKQKLNFATIYFVGMGIIALGFIFKGLVNNVYLFFITAPLMGFGGGLLMTNITAWMLSKSEAKKRVKSSGYLTSSLFLGQFFSPIATMPIVKYFGVQDFFIIIGVFIAICLLFAAFIYRLKTN